MATCVVVTNKVGAIENIVGVFHGFDNKDRVEAWKEYICDGKKLEPSVTLHTCDYTQMTSKNDEPCVIGLKRIGSENGFIQKITFARYGFISSREALRKCKPPVEEGVFYTVSQSRHYSKLEPNNER